MRVLARKTILVIFLSLMVIPRAVRGQVGADDGSDLTIPPSDRILTLATFWSEAKYNFAFWDRVEIDWDDAFVEYAQRALEVKSDIEFFRLAIEFGNLLGEAHTNIILPRRLRPAYGAQPFIELSPAGADAVVTNVARELAETIPLGSVVTRIDGREIRKYLAETVDPQVGASTPQYQFAMSLMGEDEQIAGALMGPPGTTVTLEYEAPDGETRTEGFVREQLEEFDDADWIRRGRANKPHFEWRWLDNDVAYVAIHVFWDPVVVDRFVEIVPLLRERARGIVIDVRLNGGGNSAYGDEIAGYFTDAPVHVMTWTSPMHVAVYKAWGVRQDEYGVHRAYGDGRATLDPQMNTVEPAGGGALSVPTVLLQGAYTYSAAENFVLAMRQMPQVTTVGTTTAGSTGQPLVFRLPNDVYAGITAKRDLTPGGEDFIGIGLAPDIEIHDRADAVAQGRDLPLERAVEFLLDSTRGER